MSEQENVRIVRRVYENFQGGNIAGLLGQLSDDVEWRLPLMENVPFAGTRRGRGQVAEFFSTLAGAQDVRAFEPREFVAQGDKVVALGSYSWGVKRTGREFGGEWAHVFTVRDGEVVGFHEYTDTAAVTGAYR